MSDRRSAIKGLYVVTDTVIQNRFTHEELAGQAARGGARVMQLRDKKPGSGTLFDTAARFVEVCREAGAISIINDRADIALASGADGVHLGLNDLPVDIAREVLGPDKIIGGTASTIEEALRVEQLGADYVGFGHIFETPTKKKEYAPRGTGYLKKLCEAVSIPVVAIGGIDAGNIRKVVDAGADAVAVCRAVCAAENPESAARSLQEAFRT